MTTYVENDHHGHLIIVCGLPGSGKTTTARELVRGATVIVEWGTWAREERDALRSRATELGASVELVPLDVPADELWRRLQERNMEDPPIERSDVDDWFRVWQVPDADELQHYSAPPG